MERHVMKKKALRFICIGSLLFWAPALASAQDVDPYANPELGDTTETTSSASAETEGSSSTSAGGGGSGSQFDPGPNRSAGTVEGAQDAGTLGIGADGLLSGLVGLQGRYQVTDAIGLQLALRFNVAALADTDIGFGTGFSAIFTVFGFEGGHLGIVGSVDFQLQNTTVGPMGADVTTWNIGIGAGIFAEIFPTDFFSIHGQAGGRVAFGDSGGVNTFELGIGGDILAGFGFTFWFV
jgi:hypothetical protein